MIVSRAVVLLLAVVPLSSRVSTPQPFARPLECPAAECALLQGAPQTTGWHTTGKHEEALVILHGRGEAVIDGQAKQTFTGPAFAYIPPETRHNVSNTGTDTLEYVYVVAPAKLL
jgi:mannose-6-phosphate isomerase-like protein (cupin superfamily)